MNITVPVQLVPDLVEELVIDAGGKALDTFSIRWILNEFDDHAIEQAIIIKEHSGAFVTVIVPNIDGAEDVLYSAAAKGAERLVKVSAEYNDGYNTHALARMFAQIIKASKVDLVLTGVQAHNSMDGSLGPILAELLGVPYVGYVSSVKVLGSKVIVNKEYPEGLIAELEVSLPAVLGIQAAETAPRYVPVSKIRQVMKTSHLEEQSGELNLVGDVEIERMYLPKASEKATMIEGDVDQIAEQLVGILKEQGVL